MVKSLHREFVLAYMQLNPGLQKFLLRKYCENTDRRNNESTEERTTRLLNVIYSDGKITCLLNDIRNKKRVTKSSYSLRVIAQRRRDVALWAQKVKQPKHFVF